MRFSKIAVICIIIQVTLFAIAVLWLFYRWQAEPVVLIGAYFGWVSVEAGALAAITIKKVPHEAKTEERMIDKLEEDESDDN